MKARERLLRLVVLLLGSPYRYTKAELETHFGVTSKNGLDDDFTILRQLQLLHHERRGNRYVYAILPDRGFPELKRLQPLSATDKAKLLNAIRSLPGREQTYLMQKVESLYDFSKLGLQALRKPNLEKLDRLEQAKRNRKIAILHNYRSSNSNTITDRRVQPFDINADLDTLQAVFLTGQSAEPRHFRLSRIERVTVTDDPWSVEPPPVQQTDIFRIVNNEQVPLHLTLSPRAYNELLEKFPMAKWKIEPGADGQSYDLFAQVNARFHGVLPFVLANYDQVVVHEPEALRDAVRRAGMEMLKLF